MSSGTGQSRWEDSWRGCFLNIRFQRGIYCTPILGTRTARASRTKAADGFPAPMDYFVVTDTGTIKEGVRREMPCGRLIGRMQLFTDGKYSQKLNYYEARKSEGSQRQQIRTVAENWCSEFRNCLQKTYKTQ